MFNVTMRNIRGFVKLIIVILLSHKGSFVFMKKLRFHVRTRKTMGEKRFREKNQ